MVAQCCSAGMHRCVIGTCCVLSSMQCSLHVTCGLQLVLCVIVATECRNVDQLHALWHHLSESAARTVYNHEDGNRR